MTILTNLLMGLTAALALAVLAFNMWLQDRATKRWMLMFCEKLSIMPPNMADKKSTADALAPLAPLIDKIAKKKKVRFHVPLPGAEMFRKNKVQ